MPMRITRVLLCLATLLAPARAQESIPLTEGLSIRQIGAAGRQPFFTDAVALAIARGDWSWPAEGDTLSLPGGPEGEWRPIEAADNGWIRSRDMRGGYAAISVESDRERAMILEAQGHSLVYVNGEPRAGDPYSNGLIRLPVMLRQGANTFLFRGGRGQLRATLVAPDAPVAFDTTDDTLPDLIEGETGPVWAGVGILNAGAASASGLSVRATARGPGGDVSETTEVPAIVALGVHKAAVGLPRGTVDGEGVCTIRLELRRDGETLHTREVSLRSRSPLEKHSRTFLSAIDRSVQYFGVTPMRSGESSESPDRPALFLTLHGASVEGRGQSNAYDHKGWGHVVAPTNRRPFGFDWEDWGRLDAIEVLEASSALFGADPDRTYLTGHSMGGHGTWQVGAHFPDRFAAIAPSAGWVSFWSYGGLIDYGAANPVREAFTRAASPSDTLALSDNYAGLGVYVLHGDADDNVPVSQARSMRARLAEFHRNFAYYEQPGAGHWWGNRCVDWPPMFDFFGANRRAEREDSIRFVTSSPGVSARYRWATVLEQAEPLRPSRIELTLDAPANALGGSTENVTRLALDLAQTLRTTAAGEGDGATQTTSPDPDRPLTLTLDGEPVTIEAWSPAEPIVLSRLGGIWERAERDDPARRGPHRSGPFKSVFANNAVLVYGTAGSPEENAWSLARARFDAETFKYRGNGSFDVLSDQELMWEMSSPPGLGAPPARNVVLYGNSETNAVWELLVDDVIEVTRDSVRIGGEVHRGADLGLIALRPMPRSDRALVGVVAGTGLAGCRATDRLPYFVSGVAYPDYTLFGPDIYATGIDGVVSAGFFAGDWTVREE